MPTKLEIQDRKYEILGFNVDKDYPYPILTELERKSLFQLRDHARKLEKKGEALEKFAQCESLWEILQAYKNHKFEIVNFCLIERVFTCDLPSDNTFEKLNQQIYFDGIVVFIGQDGGETRQDMAFLEDGETPKQGWIRLYWK